MLDTLIFKCQFLFESKSNQSVSQEYLGKEYRKKQNTEMKSFSLEHNTNILQYS